MKNMKKIIMAAAIFATFFNNYEVVAAEKNQNSVQVEESKKSVNKKIEELDKKISEQQEQQTKIIALLEKIRNEKVLSQKNFEKNPASALVNPSRTKKINYTQDAANFQDNSTVIFSYAPNQLYKIYCRVGYLTDLTLKKGEKISFVGGGDTSSWAVEKNIIDGVPHIYIKPTVETSTTNLIITTNKRSYQLILNTSSFYNPMVTWNYGEEEFAENNLRANEIGNINGNIENLNFNYKISGKFDGKIIVFDDGEKTILKFEKFPQNLPSVFIKNHNKKGLTLVNYKIRGNCYILDRIADEIELRMSEKENFSKK